MSSNNTTGTSLCSAAPLTPEQEQRARLAVAHYAENPEDCARLLDMLGLVPKGTRLKSSIGDDGGR